MKIGILTFHYAHNYGAVLQTYALKKYLENQGCEVRILNYQNETIARSYKIKLPYKYHLSDILHPRLFPSIIKSLLDRSYSKNHWERQHKLFEKFISGMLLEGDVHKFTKSDLEMADVDLIIAGSDQIWNEYLTGKMDPVYFIDFNTCAKKMFYGVSNGRNKVPDAQKEYYSETISKADYVSTREQGLGKSIGELIEQKVSHVVDPTLLLNKEDYEELAESIDVSEDYIFAYFIVEDEMLMDIAEYIARALKCKLIELHYYKLRSLKGHFQRADMGPKEFLKYIKNAKFVVTNSFHGTVFSVLYEKLFYSVYSSDARKDELLEHLDLRRRHIYSIAEVDLNDCIKYDRVQEKAMEMRLESTEFLQKAITELEE